MGGSKRGLGIGWVVVGSAFLVVAALVAALVAVIYRGNVASAEKVARIVDYEVRAGGVTGATPARCPSGMRVETGRSVRCSVTVDGQPVDVIITILYVGPIMVGGDIRYGIQLEPHPIPKALLERKVGELVGRSTGGPVDATSCAGDLPPVLGQRTSCTVTSAGEPIGVAVVTTGIDGGMVRFGIGPG